MKHKFLLMWSWFVRTILFFLPDIPVIMRFRGFMYGLGMKHSGKDFQVAHDAIIKGLQNISVGNNCYIANGVVVLARVDVILEDQVQIALHSVIVSGNHTSINGSYRYGKSDTERIRLCYGSWVAANSTVAKGAVLPSNSVLAANSFLNRAFTVTDSLYGGVPAQFIMQKK